MPDCWLAISNPYGPSARPESVSKHCAAEAGRMIWHASAKPNKEIYLLSVEDDFLAGVLEALSSAFHSFVQSLAAAKAAVEQSFGSLVRMDHVNQHASFENPHDAETKPHAAPSVSVARKPRGMQKLEAFSYLREQVKARRLAAEGGLRKKQTAAKVIAKGLEEFPHVETLIAQLPAFERLPVEVKSHLAAIYQFLNVPNEHVRARVDKALLHFLRFGEALNAPTDRSQRMSVDSEAAFTIYQDLNGAVTFAQIWFDARICQSDAHIPDLHYAHIAAFDFLAAGILRNLSGVPEEDFQAAELLTGLVNKIPSAPRYAFLSSKLPSHFGNPDAGELPEDQHADNGTTEGSALCLENSDDDLWSGSNFWVSGTVRADDFARQ